MPIPTIGITLKDGQDADEIIAKIREITGVTDVLDIKNQMSVLRQLSNTETWDERCAREAVSDYGLTGVSEISQHIDGAQSDMDYLIAQDETLERLVQDARDARGTGRDRNAIIAEALQDAGVEFDEDEDNPEP